MLACCRDTVTRSNGFKIIRSRARPISTHLASAGGVLHVYSQEQRRRGGTKQQDAQSFCQNSSASFKRSLNVEFVLIYTLHNIIVCDLLHPIVACWTLQGSTDPPCTLDMRIYPSDMMIIPLVLSYPNSILTRLGQKAGHFALRSKIHLCLHPFVYKCLHRLLHLHQISKRGGGGSCVHFVCLLNCLLE